MTDIEMTRICAESMGLTPTGATWARGSEVIVNETVAPDPYSEVYDPLTDDAQAMAIVKKFNLTIQREHHGDRWAVGGPHAEAMNKNLNRAIVECVAKLKRSTTP